MSSSNKGRFREINTKRCKSQGGNAVVEVAVGSFFLWLLFSVVHQYAYSFPVYDRLLVAKTNAAELGAKINYDVGNAANFTTTLQNMVLYGNETADTSPIVSGLTANHINERMTTGGTAGIPTDVIFAIGSATTPYRSTPHSAVFLLKESCARPRNTWVKQYVQPVENDAT